MSDFAIGAVAAPSRRADESEAQVRPPSTGSDFVTNERSVEHLNPVLGQQIRVSVRAGSGVPLVLCNGIGTSLGMHLHHGGHDDLVNNAAESAPLIETPGNGEGASHRRTRSAARWLSCVR